MAQTWAFGGFKSPFRTIPPLSATYRDQVHLSGAPASARSESQVHGCINYRPSHHRLYFPDRRCIAAEREQRRHCRRLRWRQQPNGIRHAHGRNHAWQGNDLGGRDFHADIGHADDFRQSRHLQQRLRVGRHEIGPDENSSRSGTEAGAADSSSTKPVIFRLQRTKPPRCGGFLVAPLWAPSAFCDRMVAGVFRRRRCYRHRFTI